jgi:hypothetical protein
MSIYFLHSCTEDKKSQSRLFNNDCYKPFIDSTFTNWKTWQKSTIENDTNIVLAYFDTLSFDRNNNVYTFSMTLFKDKVNQQFNWRKYIQGETILISTKFRLKRNGYYNESGYDHYWFLAENNDLKTYIEYITTNPLSIKTLSISKSQNDKDLCNLIQLTRSIDSSQVKR